MKFKCRCSQIGNLLTPPRSGNDRFGHTAKKVIQNWVDVENGVEPEGFSSPYTEKGIMMEDDAIEVVKEYYNLNPFLFKNEDHFENEYLTGTPDLIVDNDFLIDIKCSWEYWTFPYNDKKIPKDYYELQVQGYMDLTGCKKAAVAYVLVNTPPELNTYGIEYLKVPLKYRVKTFEFKKRNIDFVYERVMEAREYISKNYDL